MGNIRQSYIKNAARIMMQYYSDELTTDFETNKRLVEQFSDVSSKKVRNRIAGYLVRLVKRKIADEVHEATQSGEEVVDDIEM